jgi:hypothetical protein
MGGDEVMDDFFLSGGYGEHSNRGNRVLCPRTGITSYFFIQDKRLDPLFYQ